MGAKNLKAISIKGSGSVRIANPEGFQSILSFLHEKGDWDKGGFQLPGRVPLCGQKTEEDFKKKYRKKFGGPYGCPLQCMAFYDVPGIGKQNAMCASFWYCWFSQDTEATWEALHLSQKLGINHYELHGLTLFIEDTLRQGVMTADDWKKAGLVDLPTNIGGTG
jgi:aldehyde:ferredoxin oxidoreductase